MMIKARGLLAVVCVAALLMGGAAYAEEGGSRMEQLFSVLESTVEDPQTLADYDRLATMAFARGEYEAALGYLDKCLELVEESDIASLGALWMEKGAVYIKMEQPEDAKAALEVAASYTPQNLQLLLLRADLNMSGGNAKAAIEDYEMYLSLLPEDASVWTLLAQAQEKAGHTQGAKESHEKAAELAKSEENAVLSLARSNYLSGNFEAAIEGCTAYLATMDDAGGGVHFLRGAAKMQAGDHAGAVTDLTGALSLGYEDEAVAYEFLSSCYFVLGEYGKVLDVSEKSIATGSEVPAYDTMYQRMGVSALALDRYEEAIEFLNKALEINERLTGNYYYRGTCYMALENYEAAIADFTVSIERGEVLQRCYYNRGVCSIQIDAFDAGISDLETTMNMQDDPELAETAGEILWQLALHYMNETDQ